MRDRVFTAINAEEIRKVKCRYGCDNPIGVYHVPAGCVCFNDPIQALCASHFAKIAARGPIVNLVRVTDAPNDNEMIVDFTRSAMR